MYLDFLVIESLSIYNMYNVHFNSKRNDIYKKV